MPSNLNIWIVSYVLLMNFSVMFPVTAKFPVFSVFAVSGRKLKSGKEALSSNNFEIETNRFWKYSLLHSKIPGLQWLYSAFFLKLLLFFFEMYNIITSVPLSFSSLQTLSYIFPFIVSNSWLFFFTYWYYTFSCTRAHMHTHKHMHHISKYINTLCSDFTTLALYVFMTDLLILDDQLLWSSLGRHEEIYFHLHFYIHNYTIIYIVVGV